MAEVKLNFEGIKNDTGAVQFCILYRAVTNAGANSYIIVDELGLGCYYFTALCSSMGTNLHVQCSN